MNIIKEVLNEQVMKVEPELSRIDSSVANKFKELLFEIIEDGHLQMVLDLNQVKFIDSSGLGVIVAVYKKLKVDGKLVILTRSQAILTMFKITRLEKVLDIVQSDDVSDAMKNF